MKTIQLIFLFLLTLTLGFIFTTPYMAVAMVAYECMVLGLIHRKTRKKHAFFMNAAIALDLAIVLTLQFQRQAVQTAVKMELGPFQQLHILVSLIATLLYFPQLFFGWMLFQGRLQTLFYKTLHRRLGYTIFTFRTMGLILMFSMLKRH